MCVSVSVKVKRKGEFNLITRLVRNDPAKINCHKINFILIGSLNFLIKPIKWIHMIFLLFREFLWDRGRDHI